MQEEEGGGGTLDCDAKWNDGRNLRAKSDCNGVQHVGRRDDAGRENCNQILRRDNACSELVARRGDCSGALGSHVAESKMIAKRGDGNDIRRRELTRNEGRVERKDVTYNVEIRSRVDVEGSDLVAKRLMNHTDDTRENTDKITTRQVWNKRIDTDCNGMIMKKDVTCSEGMNEGRYRFYQVVEEEEEDEKGRGWGENETDERGGTEDKEGGRRRRRRRKEGNESERCKEGNNYITQSDSQGTDFTNTV